MPDEKAQARSIWQQYYGRPLELAQYLKQIAVMQPGVVYEVFVILDNYSTLEVGCYFISSADVYGLVKTQRGLFLCRKLHEWLTTIQVTLTKPAICAGKAGSLLLLKSAVNSARPEVEKEKSNSAGTAHIDGENIRIEVLGQNGSKDVTIYQSNKSRMIDVKDLALHPAAKFLVADGQSVPEEFLSVRAASSLFNVAEKYSQAYPGDEKLVFTAGSASNGSPGNCGGAPCHKTHQNGSCIDLRYMDGGGKNIRGDKAYQIADISRTLWLVKEFAKDGLTKVHTGDNTRFGLPDPTPKSRSAVEIVHRHHLHVGY